jgi:hypothetical protein
MDGGSSSRLSSSEQNINSSVYQKSDSDCNDINSIRNSKSDNSKSEGGLSKGGNFEHNFAKLMLSQEGRSEMEVEPLESLSKKSGNGKLAEYWRL